MKEFSSQDSKFDSNEASAQNSPSELPDSVTEHESEDGIGRPGADALHMSEGAIDQGAQFECVQVIEEVFLGNNDFDYVVEQLSGLKEYIDSHSVDFFKSLIILTKKYRSNESDRLKLFLHATHTAIFLHSPSVSNFVPVLERISLAAEISRFEELRGTAGQNINRELVYDIAFSRYTDEDIIAFLTREGGKKIEDIIHQLETIYADALANGTWAEPAAKKISKVIQFFTQDSRPLVRMVAEVAGDRTVKEDVNPTMGVLTLGNSHQGRMDSLHSSEPSLTDKCRHNLPIGYKAIGVSADMVIGQDTAGMPRYAGYADVEQISQTEDVGFRIIQQLEQLGGLSFFQVRLKQCINILDKVKAYYAPEKSTDEFYAEVLDVSVAYVKTIVDTKSNKSPLFQKNWAHVQAKVIEIAQNMKEDLSKREDIQTIEFTSIESLLSSSEISPFSQISEDDMVVLHQCIRPEVREKIEAELGVSIKEIPFRSLIHMFRFLSEVQGEQYERLKNVLSAHELIADKIVTAFFAVSEDTKYGEVLLNLAEKLKTDDLQKVLSKYIDLANTSFTVSMDMLASVNTDSQDSQLDHEKTAQALSRAQLGLLKRARMILEQVSTETQIVDLETYLGNMKDDVILFGSVARSLRGTGVTFEQIQGVHIESCAGDELTDIQRRQLIDIFTSVREHSSDPKALQTESLRLFEEVVHKENVTFNILYFNDEPIAFVRFEADATNPDQIYIGSFNVSKEAQGSPVASHFLHQCMTEKNEQHDLVGEVYEGRSLQFYLKLGWQPCGVVDNWHGTGLKFNKVSVPKGTLALRAQGSV